MLLAQEMGPLPSSLHLPPHAELCDVLVKAATSAAKSSASSAGCPAHMASVMRMRQDRQPGLFLTLLEQFIVELSSLAGTASELILQDYNSAAASNHHAAIALVCYCEAVAAAASAPVTAAGIYHPPAAAAALNRAAASSGTTSYSRPLQQQVLQVCQTLVHDLAIRLAHTADVYMEGVLNDRWRAGWAIHEVYKNQGVQQKLGVRLAAAAAAFQGRGCITPEVGPHGWTLNSLG